MTAVGSRIEVGFDMATAVTPTAPRWRIVLVDDHEKTRALVTSTVAALGGAVVGERKAAGQGCRPLIP
jgi:hypothetical protein